MAHPCATDPELWFGYPDDDGSDGAAKARAYERSASPAVAKPSVIRLGSRVRRRSGSPDHLPSARICVSSRRSPRRLLWCYRRPLARCSESTIR